MTAAVLPTPDHFWQLNPFNEICADSGSMNAPFKGSVLSATRGISVRSFFSSHLSQPCLHDPMLIAVLLLDNGKSLKHNNAEFFSVSDILAWGI
jgi:hypothetical protein